MEARPPCLFLRRSPLILSVLAIAGVCLVAIPGFHRAKDSTGKPAAAAVPGGPDSALRQRVEKLTGGHTRIVWARDVGPDQDPFANGNNMALMGLDTRLPYASRVLTSAQGNFSRPLLSPDGGTIIFSRRTRSGDPKSPDWSSEILTLPWEGGTPRPLRTGYAVEVWTDFSTSQTWVYAFTTLRPGVSANPEGYRLFRFPISSPDKEELIWEQGLMSGDNIQMNRSGTSASGLIPWPNAGTFDFKAGQFIRYRNGCWPALAPDDSGVVWVFDGSHENLRFFLPGLDGNWRVPLDKAEGIKGKATYHPRWSNHPSLIAFTGPHKINGSKDSGRVSVVLARFNDGLTALEDSVSLRNPGNKPDCYPDVWVAGGEKADLDMARIGPKHIRGLAAAAATRPAGKWQAATEGLCFIWERATANNHLPAEQRESSVVARHYARFGPRFDMLTGGGAFIVDSGSSTAIRRALAVGPWCMEMAVTPLAVGDEVPRVIFRAGAGLEIQQVDHDLIIRHADKEWQFGAGLSPGKTTHFALGSGPTPQGPPIMWLNGQSQEVMPVKIATNPSLPLSPGEEVQFGARADGSAAWNGRLETVTFHARPFNPEIVSTHAAWWKQKLSSEEPIPRTVVRAHLEDASPRASAESLGTYRRSWTSALYKKIALVSGPDPGATFGVAHWTILDAQPLPGPPGVIGEEIELILEPMTSHPEMESEHGSEEILPEGLPVFLDVASLGSRSPLEIEIPVLK